MPPFHLSTAYVPIQHYDINIHENYVIMSVLQKLIVEVML